MEQNQQPEVNPPRAKGSFLKKYWIPIATVVILLALVGVWIFMGNARTYKDAEDLLAKGQYEQAIEKFESLGGYRDSEERALEACYQNAKAYYEDGSFDKAIEWFDKAGDYQDAQEKKNQSIYQRGHELFVQEDYEQAQTYFDQLGEEITTYGVLHFATLEDARETIVTQALNAEPVISMEIGNLQSCMQQDNAIRGLTHLAQTELAEVEVTGTSLTIKPVSYPGVRVVAAWKNGTLDALSQEEKELYQKASGLVEQAKSQTNSQLELELWLHDWLCENVTYDNTNSGAWTGSGNLQPEWTATSALLQGKANCQGFSDAFYLLGSLAGFDVRFQYGKVGTEAHCWNVIKMPDEQWYYMDVTYDNDIERYMPNETTHAYVNFVRSQETRTIWPNSQSAEIAKSVNDSYNYYQQQNKVVSSLNDTIKTCIDKAHNGEASVDLKIKQTWLDHNQISNTLKNELNNQGIAASWTVYCINTNDATYLNLHWDSFGQ